MKNNKDFEAWAATHYVLMELSTAFEDGEYIEPEMQYASEAWQASREALVIELPVFVGAHPQTQKYVRDKCEEIIEAAGVKVKS